MASGAPLEYFFSNIPTPETPAFNNKPPNPFASDAPSVTTSLLTEQRPAKRKRIEIEPISVEKPTVQNIFFSMPPLTPTSPLTTPTQPFQVSNSPLYTSSPFATPTTSTPLRPFQSNIPVSSPFSSTPVKSPFTPLTPFSKSLLTPTTPSLLTPTTPFQNSPFQSDSLDDGGGYSSMDYPEGDISALLALEPGSSQFSTNQIDAFVNFLTSDTAAARNTNFQTTYDVSDLIDGTPSAVVKRLIELNQNLDRFKTQLDHIRYEQKQMIAPPPQLDFEKLNTDQQTIIRDCTYAKEELQHILNVALLSPTHLHLLYTLEHEFNIMSIRLELYQEELHFMLSPQLSTSKCFAALVIKKQPFPKSIKQHTKSTSSAIEDTTIVELIKAPKADCRPISVVKAGILQEDDAQNAKKNRRSSFTIQNDAQTMDDNGICRFPDLRFPIGTRLRMVRLHFSVEAQYTKIDGKLGKQLLESNLSNPFVVMTNENQWESSAQALLEFDIFGGNLQTEAPWAKVANVLQNHYLRATRQDLAEPKRPLSKFDLDYIHRYKFNGKPLINIMDFKQFWDWFGKVLHTIRHQKPFIFLWLQGLVYGFISKPEAERLLVNQPIGTFVARFSERRAGQIAIAFSKKDNVTQRMEIKHYLFDAKTTTKSLPDFVREHEKLIYLPQLKTEFLSTTGCIEKLVHKDEVLREYYTKPKWNPLEGYVDSVDGN